MDDILPVDATHRMAGAAPWIELEEHGIEYRWTVRYWQPSWPAGGEPG